MDAAAGPIGLIVVDHGSRRAESNECEVCAGTRRCRMRVAAEAPAPV